MANNQGAIEPIFQTQMLVPTVKRVGGRNVEITYLGINAYGESTWILWNADEPTFIGMLRQGDGSFVFEQRTSAGPLMHKELSRENVQLMLGAA